MTTITDRDAFVAKLDALAASAWAATGEWTDMPACVRGLLARHVIGDCRLHPRNTPGTPPRSRRGWGR